MKEKHNTNTRIVPHHRRVRTQTEMRSATHKNDQGIQSTFISARKHEITTNHQGHDPFAIQSKVRLPKSKKIVGDGDVWVETLCKNISTGEMKSFFKSTKDPNRMKPDEPPTGASNVIYLKASYLKEKFQRHK